MSPKHSQMLATVSARVFNGAPITSIGYHDKNERMHPRDSGFDCMCDDDDPPSLTAEDLRVICLHCLIDQHPEAGVGLDLARKAGFARFIGGRWDTL